MGGRVTPAARTPRGSYALDFAAGLTALVPQWVWRVADGGVSRGEVILAEWVAAAQGRVPMPLLQLRRRSALRWHVRWEGLAWPVRQITALERDLTNL